jgi:adenylylsulfate reductase subunit B
MSIQILRERCTGCGQCAAICPGGLFVLDAQGKATLPRPQDCWGCASCVKDCPAQALRLYLAEDIGGRGGMLHVRREGKLLHWIAELPNGETKIITVNRAESNHY